MEAETEMCTTIPSKCLKTYEIWPFLHNFEYERLNNENLDYTLEGGGLKSGSRAGTCMPLRKLGPEYKYFINNSFITIIPTFTSLIQTFS